MDNTLFQFKTLISPTFIECIKFLREDFEERYEHEESIRVKEFKQILRHLEYEEQMSRELPIQRGRIQIPTKFEK